MFPHLCINKLSQIIIPILFKITTSISDIVNLMPQSVSQLCYVSSKFDFLYFFSLIFGDNFFIIYFSKMCMR